MRFIKSFPDGIHTPFAIRDARDAGATRSQLRNSAFVAPFHGTRMLAAAEPTLTLRCAALLSRMPDRIVFSHTTAARLHGMWLPFTLDDTVHTTLPAPQRCMRRKGARGHSARLIDADRTRIGELPVTTVERTWCDLGSILELPDLVAAADGLLCHKNSRTTVVKLQAVVARQRNRPYHAKLRRALGLVTDQSASRPESLVRVELALSNLPTPIPNFRLNLTHRPGYRVVDLAYPDYRLGLEYHGDHHRTDKGQWHTDVRRMNEIIDEDWEELQFTGADLPRLDLLRERVERRLRARGWCES
ncbi:hypothetical protein [Paramicrobacterium chengjingii]|uniref:hypothetical protein n=1 Tax=Paramicrobacterium chengjingii TaxID=2769067 RepID=UPI0014208DEC|nr:hypothetical protein [Microbacterium chengjingii]